MSGKQWLAGNHAGMGFARKLAGSRGFTCDEARIFLNARGHDFVDAVPYQKMEFEGYLVGMARGFVEAGLITHRDMHCTLAHFYSLQSEMRTL